MKTWKVFAGVFVLVAAFVGFYNTYLYYTNLLTSLGAYSFVFDEVGNIELFSFICLLVGVIGGYLIGVGLSSKT